MRIPWLRLFNALVYAFDFVRVGTSRATEREDGPPLLVSPDGPGL